MRLLLASLFLLSACHTPDTTTQVRDLPDMPESFDREPVEGQAAVSGEAWWQSFGDEELDLLVREALEANYDMAQAAALLRASYEGARVARALRGPSLDATFGASRSRQNFIGLPIPGAEGEVLSNTVSNWDLGLQASWEVDLWNRLGAQEKAARLDIVAARADYEAARHALAAAVTRGWFLVVEAKLQMQLAERTVESFEQNERIVRDRYEAGLVAALDLRSASANTRTAKALMAERERALMAARRSLDILLGRYPEGELEGTDDLASLPPAVPAGLPAELLARRPDLRAAEARVLAAEQRVESVRANLYPSLVLTGNVGTLSQEIGDLLDGDFRVWSWAGRVLQPLYDGGRRRAEVRAEAAQRDALQASFAQSFLGACSEVENALENEQHLVRQVEELRLGLEDSRAAEQLALDQYREGLVALVTVLDAQRRALDSESSYLSARRTLLENRVSLHTALGGGFDVLAVPEEEPEEESKDDERSGADSNA